MLQNFQGILELIHTAKIHHGHGKATSSAD